MPVVLNGVDIQKLIWKHAPRFASDGSHEKKILQGVHFTENGTVLVTNAHYALRIKNAHRLPVSQTLHAISLKEMKGNYPDISRVFPSEFNVNILLSSNIIQDLVHYLKLFLDLAKLNRHDGTVLISFQKGRLRVALKLDDLFCTYVLRDDVDPKLTFRVFLNGSYLLNALLVFKDLKNDVMLRINRHQISKIVLDDAINQVDVLIMPIRVLEAV